jgi:hypothetical protein
MRAQKFSTRQSLATNELLGVDSLLNDKNMFIEIIPNIMGLSVPLA